MRYLIPAMLLIAGCAATSPAEVRSEKPRTVIAMSASPTDAADCSEKRLLALSYGESNEVMARTLPVVSEQGFGASLVGRDDYGTPYAVDFDRAESEATVYVSRGYYRNDEIAEILTGIVRACATG